MISKSEGGALSSPGKAEAWNKAYSPKNVEEKWINLWDKAEIFSSVSKPESPAYSLVIPPPNVTGALHIGHALNNTIQDILARWRRMSGDEVCWAPGTDHGGIATQTVMEKMLKAENSSRRALGREAFVLRMQAWTMECKQTILGQLKRLGCSLDFSREAFTMDSLRSAAVFEAFRRLWEKKLIYRGERMVNWCVRCGTALSDIEVEHEERKGSLWHIHYKEVSGGSGLIIATTRPETLLGDVAVAVHPEDARYKSLIGKKLVVPLVGREIPIVADSAVDSSFGTGAVKVTPAHDPNDFEIALRHGLPKIKIIDPAGKITSSGGAYAGLSREEARKKVIADLAAQGLLEKIEPHPYSVGVCYRCQEIIEPLLSWQWFVKMRDMALSALKSLDQGKFKIDPMSWEKPYRDWLLNIRDWCVSRQIWWGHPIPVWYCKACNDFEGSNFSQKENLKGMVVSLKEPDGPCPDCGLKNGGFVSDPDVLDTWFSSALWPFSVFSWPQQTETFARYYPTRILVTGYEIIYLWVARMQMMGLELTGEPPFAEALIHGIVRDKKGKKMSKSLGNVIDPLVMMDQYGTDALRFSLILQARPGKDIVFSEESIVVGRNFVNKIWNTARFALMNVPPGFKRDGSFTVSQEPSDLWILSEYQKTTQFVKNKVDEKSLAEAAGEIYEFLWDKFCDWYVELAKLRLQGSNELQKEEAFSTLLYVLNGVIKMAHSFMPFVTEEIYAALKPLSGESSPFLATSRLPEPREVFFSEENQNGMAALIDAVAALRSFRSQLGIAPGVKMPLVVCGEDAKRKKFLIDQVSYLEALCGVKDVVFSRDEERPARSAAAVSGAFTFHVSLEGLIDFNKESERLKKEIAKTEEDRAHLSEKLADPRYLERAAALDIAESRSLMEVVVSKNARLKELLKCLQ